jgi:3-oxoacyl-[acyl-carrier protein] reductase
MSPDLKNQIALVTGAGRGIGRAIAISLARAGAEVILVSRTASELEKVAAGIRDSAGLATLFPADLTDESQIQELFKKIPKLDILINNAGIGFFGPIKDYPVDQLDKTFAINVRGTFLCCREAMKLMTPARSGYIINMSSVVGFKGYENQAVYAASKHAVMGLTKSLAVECRPHNIRVSAVLPGGVDTGMIGTARPDLSREGLIAPDDIANCVLYLLSLATTNAAVDEIYIRRRTSAPF